MAHDGLRSRKLWMTIGVQAMWLALLLSGFLTEASFVALSQWTLSGYFVANVFEKRGPQ